MAIDSAGTLALLIDLRRELLKRRIQVAADDSRPGISMEEMKALLREKGSEQDLFPQTR